jgi:hypothetical protein
VLVQKEGTTFYGVMATAKIEAGVIIGQYLGHIKAESKSQKRDASSPVSE